MPRIPGISEDDAVRAFNAYTMGAIAADAGFDPEEFKDLLR